MYNIAKVVKGEILVYFNEVFDALTKVKDLLENHKDAQAKWLVGSHD
jgi:hypothetical protein